MAFRRAQLGTLLGLTIALASCGSPTGNASPPASGATGPIASPSGALPGASGSVSPAGQPSDPAPAPSSHTVGAGDTLSSIAERYGVSVAQLQEWNAERYPSLITDPGALQVGWTLAVSAEGTGGDSEPTGSPPPPPTATGCRAGNRVAAGGQELFRTVPGAGNGVALTFDMGGRIEPAVEIMNYLVENGVCATIFATGVMSQTDEGEQVMAIIRAHPELFEVGNHTMHHCNLRDGGGGSPSTVPCPAGRPSADFVREQLLDAAAVLAEGAGQAPAPYWRPPYGAYDQAVLDAAASAGYTKTFMWDIDTVDWKPESEGGPTAEQITSNVVNNAVSGSNVLMHLGGWNTRQALPSMIAGLRARGFVLTSLSDLLQ